MRNSDLHSIFNEGIIKLYLQQKGMTPYEAHTKVQDLKRIQESEVQQVRKRTDEISENYSATLSNGDTLVAAFFTIAEPYTGKITCNRVMLMLDESLDEIDEMILGKSQRIILPVSIGYARMLKNLWKQQQTQLKEEVD